MKKIVVYKGVSYPLDILGSKEIELMKVEIEKQHPDYFKKKEIPKKEVQKKNSD